MSEQKISEGQVPSRYFLSTFIGLLPVHKRVIGSQFQTQPAVWRMLQKQLVRSFFFFTLGNFIVFIMFTYT